MTSPEAAARARAWVALHEAGIDAPTVWRGIEELAKQRDSAISESRSHAERTANLRTQRDKVRAQLDRIEALCEPDLINPEAGCAVDSRKIRAILDERT